MPHFKFDVMTQNRRIVLNVVATYGRSLYGLACGLFTCRWLLMSLGKEDYGLYGVVGGLSGFVMFISYILQGATSRFYAYSIGNAKNAATAEDGLEACRKWFNTSLAVHTIVPLLLALILYFAGDWAVCEFLDIPRNRVEACRWVLRFTCISCFASMVNVPLYGMYVAKQYIAELTIYNFISSTLNVVFVYYMTTHPGDWLAGFAAWGCILSVATQFLIGVRAMMLFTECRINFSYWLDVGRYKEMADYAGWNLLGGIATTLQGQGSAVLVNKYFGPIANAGYSVANSVNMHCTTLAAAMRGAFIPALTTICGSGDYVQMRRMAMRACKFASLLALFFMLPIALELPKIIELWLKSPPPHVVGLCWCMMICSIVDYLGMGQSIAICAFGKVARYQLAAGTSRLFMLPLAWGLISCGCNIYAIGISYIIVIVLYAVARAWLARSLAKLSAREWGCKVVFPVGLVICATLCIGSIPKIFMEASVARMIVSSFFTITAFASVAWVFALSRGEKDFLIERMKTLATQVNAFKC